MKKDKFKDLRRQAEERLSRQENQIESLDRAELAKMAHELAVHQVELEIQNEELSMSRADVERVRDLYLDLYDFAPVGYLTLDGHSRVVEANLTASNALMKTKQDLLKLRFTKFINPDESQTFHLFSRKVMESEGKQMLELKMQKADGTPFDAQLVSIRTGQSRLRIAFIDITDRKKLEKSLAKLREDLETQVLKRTAELRKSEEDYRKIIETANDGVWITDPDGRVLFINNKISEMLGYSREEVIGKVGIDFVCQEQADIVLGMRRELDTGRNTKYELLFQHKNGLPVWVLASASPLYENEKHSRNLYMMTDITERKKAEEELKDIPRRILQAQEAERQSIGRELHDEIGQSLTYVTLLLDRISRVPAEKSGDVITETKQVVVKVLGQVRHLSLELQPGKLEHLGLTETLAQYFLDYSSKTGIKVDFKFSGVQDILPYDLSLAIYRICQEALTNIARHAGVSEAAVRLWKDLDTLYLRIEDKGNGFKPDSIKKDSSGLISMRERARMLGGNLEIESISGQGTQIVAELPLKDIKH